MPRKRNIITSIGAFIIFTVSVSYLTYPLIFHLGDYITGFGDELLIAWIQNWVIHALAKNPFQLFDANIYFPYHNTLAYSHPFITTALLSAIPRILIPQPIVTVNFTLFSSLILLGFSIYFVVYRYIKDFSISLLCGLLVIFSPAVLDKYVHLQILAIYFVPLSLYFFQVFIKSRKTKHLVISLSLFVFQTYNSFQPGYFILFGMIATVLCYWYKGELVIKQYMQKKHFFLTLFFFLTIVPLCVPYYFVSHEFNYVRDIRDTIHLALQPEDFFYTNQFSRLEPVLNSFQHGRYSDNAEVKAGYLGVTFTILTILSLVYCIKHIKHLNAIYLSILSIALVGVTLSFGPFLHLNRQTIHMPFPIPLPYALFYYIAPGFKGIRNSSLWQMLFVVAMAILIGFFLHKVLRKTQRWQHYLISITLIFTVILEYNYPMQFIKIQKKEEFPKVYKFLNTTPADSRVIELPIYTWYMQPYVFAENMREYYATVHFRKMVNGASGYSPQPWQNLVVTIMKNFPDNSSLQLLRSNHINYLIIHKKEYDILKHDKFVVEKRNIPNGEIIIKELFANPKVKFIKQIQEDYIFTLD